MIPIVVLLSAAGLTGHEPLLCSGLDPNQISVVTGRVDRRTVTRREQRPGVLPFQWEITYEVVAVVRPLRTLRGTPVTRPVTTRIQCNTPWLDIGGRRSCTSLLKQDEVDTFQVDRRTFQANRNPDRDEVADYDHRLLHPLPRCEH